jgi:hypothetical protein
MHGSVRRNETYKFLKLLTRFASSALVLHAVKFVSSYIGLIIGNNKGGRST